MRGADPIYAQVYGYGGNTGDYEIGLTSELYLTLDQKLQAAPVLSQAGDSPTGSISKIGEKYYIDLDSVVSGEIESILEVDYYKLDVSPGNVVALTLNTLELNEFPKISMIDSDGSDVLSGITLSSGYYEPYGEFVNSEFVTGSQFSRLGMDVESGTQNIYVKVEFTQGLGEYSLSYEIYKDRSAVADTITGLTNQERQEVGVAPLSRNNLLDNAAYNHSYDMLINDFQSHTGSNGSSISDRVEDAGYDWSSVGENIHTTHGAFNAVQAWMTVLVTVKICSNLHTKRLVSGQQMKEMLVSGPKSLAFHDKNKLKSVNLSLWFIDILLHSPSP